MLLWTCVMFCELHKRWAGHLGTALTTAQAVQAGPCNKTMTHLNAPLQAVGAGEGRSNSHPIHPATCSLDDLLDGPAGITKVRDPISKGGGRGCIVYAIRATRQILQANTAHHRYACFRNATKTIA